ncbi:MAG: hypothetical protein ORN27_08515 [Rhodoluna sp.]|nr:hypothetical protein [Rhodoluna sp.]
MFSTPYCQHQFSEEQLASLEWVVCPCGYHFRSANLRAYATKFAAYNKARQSVEALVAEIGADHASRLSKQSPVAAAQAAPAATYTPAAAKPKRAAATISVSQWLIISASILVLVAASVFVQSNIDTWQAPQWLILESLLGVASVAGAIFGRKISVLLSNFLAVFSAGMLMSLIMTTGTQLNLGFVTYNHEPAWYWAINLAIVSAATSFASIRAKNFGWRALSPVALTISGLLLTYGAVGDAIRETPNAFAWQLITLSFTAIALLIQLRFLRAIKQNVDPKSENREYEEDLYERENNALQRFATFTTIFLAVVGTGVTLVQLLTNFSTPFDALATLSLGALWLLGSSTIDFWGTPLSRTGVVAKRVKTATWTLAYVSIGVGLNSLVAKQGIWLSIGVALFVTLVLATLPRYARFVKPPMATLNATTWAILGTWVLWNVNFGEAKDLFAVGVYLIGFATVTVASDLITKSKSSNITALITSGLSALIFATTWFSFDEVKSLWGAEAIGLATILLVANLSSLTSDFLAKRTKTEKPAYIAWVTLGVGMVSALIFSTVAMSRFSFNYFIHLGLMLVLLAWALGAQLLNRTKPATTRELQALGAFVVALYVLVQSLGDSFYNIFNGLVVLGFAIVAYLFGYLEKAVTKLQIGLGAGILALYIALGSPDEYNQGYQNQAFRFALLFALVPALVFVHNFALNTRTKISQTALSATNITVVLLSAAITPLVTVSQNQDRVSDWVWAYLAAGLVAFAAIELKKLVSVEETALQLRIVGFGFLALGLLAVWFSAPTVDAQTNHLRQVIFMGVITVASWRTTLKTKEVLWIIGGYVGSVLFSLTAGDWIHSTIAKDWSGPELTSLILAAALAVNGFVANKAQSKSRLWLVSDIPVFVAVLPSLVYSTSQGLDSNESIARLLGVGVILAVYGYWRTLQSKVAAWVAVGYIGSSLAAAMVVEEFRFNLALDLRGPELYSIAVLATTFLGINMLRRVADLKGTLVTWGAPLAVAIVPSAVYSYQAITSPFADLDALQVTRVLAVLVISATALIIGMRAGNLGAAAAGTIGLTLVAVPNLWFRFDGVAGGQTNVELRALLVGGFVFLILAVSKQFKLTAGNSIVYVGIPTMIALAPAVLNTLDALTHPTFQAIDWWRFAIVLSVSLTLLIVGSLRELGGMFYPGFAGVLVSALPYGFRQIEGAAWLLWIILLLVAGTLIWLATRIEKMRKLGRTPAMWLKELK